MQHEEALGCNYYGCVTAPMWIRRLLSHNGECRLQPRLRRCNAIITSQKERVGLTRQVMAAITGAGFHRAKQPDRNLKQMIFCFSFYRHRTKAQRLNVTH